MDAFNEANFSDFTGVMINEFFGFGTYNSNMFDGFGCWELIQFNGGCQNPFACNYDPTAEYEDGSCIYPEIGFDCDEEFEGCYNDNDLFFPIGGEWFITDCEFFVCEGQNSWSDINVLDDCLGCFDDFGVFYNLGSELFLGEDSCSFIFCESPGSWSEVIEIPDCAGAGCYSDDGVFYNVGDEMYLNDCEYTYCESPGNWSEI